MKIIVAGSRDLYRPDLVGEMLDEAGWKPTHIISGCARGADKAGEAWAQENGVEVIRMPADWGKHGRAAGPIRNREMAKIGDALAVIWDGKSRGTANMLEEARKRGLPVATAICGEAGALIVAEPGEDEAREIVEAIGHAALNPRDLEEW